MKGTNLNNRFSDLRERSIHFLGETKLRTFACQIMDFFYTDIFYVIYIKEMW